MKIMPNQILAHKTPGEAWQYAKILIENYGNQVKTEDGKLTGEICNLHLCILEPLSGWPISGAGWGMSGLDEYADQLMNPENIGFDYTYGNRLRAHECVFDDPDDCLSIMEWDQIGIIMGKLKRQPTSRRCVAITWYPERDILADHAPCLQLLDFLIRGGKLNLTAFFRSWDVGRAAVPNMYGLARLQEHVAKEVNVPMGNMTIMAASAHIYEA